METWKQVGRQPYEASSLGRIRRLHGGKGTYAGRILTPGKARNGYLTVLTSEGGVKKRQLVHRMVCEAFHGEPPTPDHQAAHKNGVKEQCAENNVVWKTRQENEDDKIAHGTYGTVLTEAEARAILSDPRKQAEIALDYGVGQTQISRIKRGLAWPFLSACPDTGQRPVVVKRQRRPGPKSPR